MSGRAALLCFAIVVTVGCDERDNVPLEPQTAASSENVQAAADRVRQTTNAELEETRNRAAKHAPELAQDPQKDQSSGKNE